MEEEIDEAKQSYLYREPLVFAIHDIKVKHSDFTSPDERRDALIELAQTSGLPRPLIDERIASLRIRFAATPEEEEAARLGWTNLLRDNADWIRSYKLTPVSADAVRYLEEC